MNGAVERINDLDTIFFPKLGLKFHIDPTAFHIGGVSIQWYGIIITVGLILALVYCLPKMKRFGLDADRTIDAVIGGVLGGIVGARIYYVIWKWDDYQRDTVGETLKAMVNTRNGGLAIYGGLIGALIVGLIICKIRKVKTLPMLDITVIGFLIGQGIGRWGNFVNQEAFGTNTDSFLGMTGGRIQETILSQTQIGGDMYNNGLATMLWEKPVHPCFLYESVWCLLGFLVLSFWSKRRKYDGQLLLMYMAWYGAERFIVEGLRTDSLMVGNIRVSKALSAIIFIVSVILQIIFFFRRKRDPESFVLYSSTEESRLLIEEGRRKRMGMTGSDAMIMADEDDDIGILPPEDEDEAEEVAEAVEEKTEEVAEAVEEEAEEVAEAAEEEAEEAVEAVEEKAEEVAEAVEEKAEEAAEAAEEKAEEAVEAVEEKAGEVAEAAEEKAEEAVEAAEEKAEEAVEAAVEEAEDKYEQLAEAVDERLTGGSGKSSHNKKKRRK